ncbi:MAG: hypothetical protein IOD12_14925 [Silvanigrellales bacterium]|nr:hypothetical protein [Silvanigrellales bacterium]
MLHQKLRRGEIPRQFSFALFGESFVCEKEGRGRADHAEGSGAKWPFPLPTSAEPEAGRFSALCDGEHKMIVRGEGVTLSSGSFTFANACAAGVKQFKEQGGCFCDAEHAVVCLDRGPTLLKIGSAFSFAGDCAKALGNRERGIEVRYRKQGD